MFADQGEVYKIEYKVKSGTRHDEACATRCDLRSLGFDEMFPPVCRWFGVERFGIIAVSKHGLTINNLLSVRFFLTAFKFKAT